MTENLYVSQPEIVYGMEVLADAPEAAEIVRKGAAVKISFRNGNGLYKKECDFSSYNGFALSEIREDLIPPVLGGINGLRVYADGEAVPDAVCSVENDCLVIRADGLEKAEQVRAEFAQTGFYQVNLYNEAAIPAKPFVLEMHSAPGPK